MQVFKGELAILMIIVIGRTGRAQPQSARDKLQRLVETSARRLAIAKQVALAKWDSQAPVEDAAREARVIATATKAGESRGLAPVEVSNFFRAQIEANKLVQYSLLAEWRRAGKAPPYTRVNLVNAVRAELDQLETALIVELADTADIRASAACPAETAKAIEKYLAGHKVEAGALQAIALNRAMAATCTYE